MTECRRCPKARFPKVLKRCSSCKPPRQWYRERFFHNAAHRDHCSNQCRACWSRNRRRLKRRKARKRRQRLIHRIARGLNTFELVQYPGTKEMQLRQDLNYLVRTGRLVKTGKVYSIIQRHIWFKIAGRKYKRQPK